MSLGDDNPMTIPKEIKKVVKDLKENGFEAYLVGGCVRDLLRSEDPKDWDIATNANPEQIIKIFPKNFAENKFGTVTVLTESKIESLKEVEITPYRTEAEYTDKRHPDEVHWAKTIEEDLSRRDFTINAIAIDVDKLETKKEIIDPFNGQEDLKKKIIATVGNPKDRFFEDALRMMRAVRFSSTLGFEINKETKSAIKKNSIWIDEISKERVRDELLKIIMSDRASEGIEALRELGLLKYIMPELEEGYGVGQNKHHIFNCYEHSIESLKYAAKKKFNQNVRMAVLLHDIAKPRVKAGNGADSTFYNHEIVGAKMAYQILDRLRFSKKEIEKIVKLVRFHLFYYNVGEVTESSVRRLVNKVGLENMEELLEVRMSDRIGSGVPKAEPYKLRHLKYVIDKVSQDPLSAKMLKVNGEDIMKELGIKPGPKIGWMLEILLSKVLIDPEKNNRDYLMSEVKRLSSIADREIEAEANSAKSDREKIEVKKDEMTKKKYWVM